MKDIINKAELYINQNKGKVNEQYKPGVHFSPQIGWINDPNGFSFENNIYHLYYQYYPYDSKWGPMHWGHAITEDLINWKHLPIALAPSENYDGNGIFSGTALIENNMTSLYYTGHVDDNGKIIQTQCLASSKDGIIFEKYKNNPILKSDSMPNDSVVEDFRDPKIIHKNNIYYLLLGSRTKEHQGQILFYKSSDGKSFNYANRILVDKKYGDIVECPDLLEIDNKDILIFSTQKAVLDEAVQNAFSTFAFVGQFNFDECTFMKENEQILDYGFDFYAPQTTQNDTLIAWMNSWERDNVTDKLGHQWSGSMTIPRKLSLNNNQLMQSFPHTLMSEKNLVYTKHNLECAKLEAIELPSLDIGLIEFETNLDESNILILKLKGSDKHYFEFKIDGKQKCAVINRSLSNHLIHSKLNENEKSRIMPIKTHIKCSILFDRSSIEININGKTMTSLYYGDQTENNIEIISITKNVIRNLKIYKF